MPSNNGTTLLGWTASPDGRGTWDIIVSCVFTIALCCWTSVCPNIPAASDTRFAQFRDKFDLACIGLLGPEFLLGIAVGQRTSARRSVEKFKEADFHDWTLTHAFFADMGGFVLEADDLLTPIPLNAEQLFFLVKKKYVGYPTITKDDIADRDKVDGLARLLAVGQAVWFAASCIARPIQGLSMTTLELTTISFIFVMFGTSYCWMHKPSDVSIPVKLTSKKLISTIRKEYGLSDPDEYRSTPLDFVNDDTFIMDLIWDYYIHLLRILHIPLFSRPIGSRPHNRNRGNKFLKTDLNHEILACIVILPFSASFICAWSFTYPSQTERILWHCASIYTLVYGAVGGLYTWIWLRVLAVETGVVNTTPQKRNIYDRISAMARKSKRVSWNDDPNSSLPVAFMVPVTALCALYCLSRTYILTEDFIGLRALPPSAYDTVDWSQYIPHI